MAKLLKILLIHSLQIPQKEAAVDKSESTHSIELDLQENQTRFVEWGSCERLRCIMCPLFPNVNAKRAHKKAMIDRFLICRTQNIHA